MLIIELTSLMRHDFYKLFSSLFHTGENVKKKILYNSWNILLNIQNQNFTYNPLSIILLKKLCDFDELSDYALFTALIRLGT